MSSGLDENYRGVCARIVGASRPGQVVTLVAVSKFQTDDSVEALYRLGHRDFGESYVQDLVKRAGELKRRGCGEMRWHFIGHLQTNKVKALLPWVISIHSVDSVKLAREISKRWGAPEALPIFVEVNIDEEPSKAGFKSSDVLGGLEEIARLPGISVQGLMCVPSEEGDPAIAFRRLRELSLRAGALTQGALSMGMSSDFEMAIREGATHVRVGGFIFGERPISP
ncbi:YggS family pyridoxal phosphate-dependent enzyme [Bdellovibrionota bacterium FG-2]